MLDSCNESLGFCTRNNTCCHSARNYWVFGEILKVSSAHWVSVNVCTGCIPNVCIHSICFNTCTFAHFVCKVIVPSACYCCCTWICSTTIKICLTMSTFNAGWTVVIISLWNTKSVNSLCFVTTVANKPNHFFKS